ncbi:MAG: hypothetical protein LLG04_18955 [Parachlamydia sp.]|nr:hypothetical protein [Parachlamydia sp.]
MDDANLVNPIAGVITLTGNATQGVSTFEPVPGTAEVTVAQSTTIQNGVVTLATNAQAIAGTDSANAVTSSALAAKLGTQTAHGVIIGEGTSSAMAATAAGSAGQILQSAGAAADPAYTTATYPATTTAGEVLLSSANNTVVSSPFIQADSVGIVTLPSNSNASAYCSVDIPNVTGDLTSYTVLFDTTDYDIQSEYDPLTGAFTCTKAGIYLVSALILFINTTGGQTAGNLRIVRNADIWWQTQFNPALLQDAGAQFSVSGVGLVPCAVGDTLTIVVQVGTGAKTMGIGAAAGAHSQVQFSKIA